MKRGDTMRKPSGHGAGIITDSKSRHESFWSRREVRAQPTGLMPPVFSASAHPCCPRPAPYLPCHIPALSHLTPTAPCSPLVPSPSYRWKQIEAWGMKLNPCRGVQGGHTPRAPVTRAGMASLGSWRPRQDRDGGPTSRICSAHLIFL